MKLVVKHINGTDVYANKDNWDVAVQIVESPIGEWQSIGSLVVKYDVGSLRCQRVYAPGAWQIWEKVPE